MVPSQTRAACEKQRRELTRMSACTVILITPTIFCASAIRKRVRRPAAVRRQRCPFETISVPVTARLHAMLSHASNVFYKLLSLLKPRLMRNANMGRRSSAGIIEPAVRLAIFLRILSGASYPDLELAFRVGRGTIYKVFLSILDVVLLTIPMPGVPADDAEKLRELAEGFRTSRSPNIPLWGCVAALDGIAIAVWKPLDQYFPRYYFTRKGFYALPVPAHVDASYRFLYMSARCVGSTHDSLAWSCSLLGNRLLNGLSLGEFWTAGDADYVYSNNLFTPYSRAQIHDAELGPRRDSFNFYQSSLRMHVEQAFSIPVSRFGVLWKPMRYPMPMVSRILSSCM
jgi:DDE superfamily endonuclease